MNNREISTAIIDACKNSNDLNSFSNSVFGKSITYMQGMNLDRDEYSVNEYADLPLVVIDPIQINIGDSSDFDEFSFGIITKIVKDGSLVIKPVDSVITYSGIFDIDEFNQLIIDAVKAHSFFKCLDISELETGAEPVRALDFKTEYNGFIRFGFTREKIRCIGA